jgi:hypothetical protein
LSDHRTSGHVKRESDTFPPVDFKTFSKHHGLSLEGFHPQPFGFEQQGFFIYRRL